MYIAIFTRSGNGRIRYRCHCRRHDFFTDVQCRLLQHVVLLQGMRLFLWSCLLWSGSANFRVRVYLDMFMLKQNTVTLYFYFHKYICILNFSYLFIRENKIGFILIMLMHLNHSFLDSITKFKISKKIPLMNN